MSITPWKPWNPVPNAEPIAAGLKNIPSHWSLTPLKEKQALRPGWQTEDFIPHQSIADLILNGEQAISKRTGKPYRRFWSGFGLRLGEASDGLLAIDLDGESAKLILEAMGCGNISPTVSWTSGKPGRCQVLYRVPDSIRANLKDFTRAVITEWNGSKTAQGELLELRYNRCQSALPPSFHPETGGYSWINSHIDTDVDALPAQLCEIVLKLAEGQKQDAEAKLLAQQEREKAIAEATERRKALGIVGSIDLIDCFTQSVARLSPEEIFNWSGHHFKRKGKEWFGCCPQHQSQSGESFSVNPDTLEWKCFGCDVGGRVGEYRHFVNGGRGTPRGKDFYNVTKELAREAGIELPKHQPKNERSQPNGFKKEPESKKQQQQEEKPLPKPRLDFNCFYKSNPEFEEKIRQVQRKLRSLSYKPDILLNQRYFPDDLPHQIPKSGLIGLVGNKGSGKSQVCKKIIQLAKKLGITILSITPRIALGREQAVKWEITWIDDHGVMQTKSVDTTEQIFELSQKIQVAEETLKELSVQQLDLLDERATERVEKQKADLRIEIENYGQQIENVKLASVNTLALCWDSIWRTKDRDLKNSLIIVDEAELGFKHFITGSTCRQNRPHLLKVFTDKISECLMSGGRVILSDADLTDLTINYVRQLLPIPINPFIIKNEYISDKTKWIVDFRNGNRGCTLDEILELVEQGHYLAITTDSQAEAKALETKILQEYPEFCSFIDPNTGEVTPEAVEAKRPLIVRIDSTTTETEAGKKFIQKPNKSIQHWKPRLVIYTPSMGVGVSIDEDTQRIDESSGQLVPYFDCVVGLMFGVIEPSECRQQLSRVRANVPRIVWVKDSNRALEGCNSFFPSEIKKQTLKYNHATLSIIDVAKGIAGYDADDEEIREAMLKVLQENWDSESKCWKEPSIELYAAFKARENYGKWNLSNLLREELEDEGHLVTSLQGTKTELVEEMKAIKDEQKQTEAALIAEAEIIPLEEAQKIRNKLGATNEEKRSAQKTLLADELPEVDLTAEFIYKAVTQDRRRWLNQHKLFWYYSNFDAVKEIDVDHYLGKLKKFAEGCSFMPDIRTFSPKVKAAQQSGLFDFINLDAPDRVYEGNSPEAQKFLKQALKAKEIIKVAFNVAVTKKTEPISLANRLLSKFGLEIGKITRSHKDCRYQIDSEILDDPDRLAVLRALDLKWETRQNDLAQKTAETVAQQGVDLGGEVANIYIQNESSPPNLQSHDCAVYTEPPAVDIAVVASEAEVVAMSDVVEEAIATRPSLSDYKPGQEVWAYFPQSQDGWLKGAIEWIKGNTIRVVSGYFGIFVENPDAIAPGHWQLT